MGTFFIFSRDLYGNCRQTVDYERLSRSAGKLYAHALSQLFELILRHAFQLRRVNVCVSRSFIRRNIGYLLICAFNGLFGVNELCAFRCEPRIDHAIIVCGKSVACFIHAAAAAA